jgi:putative transposase
MDPRKIAHWRYEQIEDLLDDSLTDHERHVLLRRIARTPVRWPSGQEQRISEATLYRWLRAYQDHGLQGLMPSPRRDKGARRRMEHSVVERAISYLREEPRRTLTMLIAFLKVTLGRVFPRSTLHRHLKAHPAYKKIRLEAKGNLDRRLRRRFQAQRPHQIWQCDSKGPFPVKLSSGKVIQAHVLTIIDDFSRATLAWLVTPSPDLSSAIQVFRAAARRYGLPKKFYADRASIFDSHAFRAGMAELGVHRIRSKARNAPARGKIEAYHRIIESWFVRELRHQIIHDIEHLQALLTGVLEGIYLDHRHRGIHETPRQALAGRISDRLVSADRLFEAFLVRITKKSHPKTGEVELGKSLFRVHKDLAGNRSCFAYDLVDPTIAFVEKPGGKKIPLDLAVAIVEDTKPGEAPRGDGRLQALYDHVRGGLRPQAEAGFGLPELFSLLAGHLGRRVPIDEAEARSIGDFYRTHGPLGRKATEEALVKVFSKLGPDRPLATYLAALAAKIQPPPH